MTFQKEKSLSETLYSPLALLSPAIQHQVFPNMLPLVLMEMRIYGKKRTLGQHQRFLALLV